MHRVLIIGSSGAGKSTLSRSLAAVTGVPVVHLDAEFWQPGWREMPRNEWTARVAELLQRDRWIMDGNYGGTLPQRVEAADTVVLLALPRLRCLLRVVGRSVRGYGKARPDLNPECPEQLPDLEFLRWIWTYPREKLPGVLALLHAHEREKTIVILRTPGEVDAWLARVAAGQPPLGA